MNRRHFLAAAPAVLMLASQAGAAPAKPRKGVMLMNRIGPTSAELFSAKADGSGERLISGGGMDFHAAQSHDGRSIVFTSERNGLGQADIFLARADGSAPRLLVGGPSVDDAAALSPDGARLAFVSSRQGFRANIWVMDLKSGRLRNLTGAAPVQGDPSLPDGFFRPAWSPDGRWLAFSSDRNTDWRGHDNGTGWEHTQELSVYVIGADGQGFRRVASRPGYCLGSPKWSPDGRRIVFYEMTTEETWGARRPERVASVISQIVSVDVATGERVVHTSGLGLKVYPHFIGRDVLAFHRKGGEDEGLRYTDDRPLVKRALRSPSWSADGATVVYEKVGFKPREQSHPLYSWDPDWDYRYTDVFPALSRDGKTLVFTEKALNSSIAVMNPDGTGRRRIFDPALNGLDPALLARGTAGAFAPAWSPDGAWIAFGVGQWFQGRANGKAALMRIRRDGTGLEALTDGTQHCGFPSYSADGKALVFRTWTETGGGLSILDLETRKVRQLTDGFDNLPGWSPDGKRIVFTRRVDAVNFDVFTIRPDGQDLQRLTTNRGNDGHAVWTADGRILWNGSAYGFRDEAALYDNTFQQYGQIWVMNADGTGKRMLTDSLWEDAMPLYVPSRI